MARKEFGQFIVVDDDICHGQAIFKGTRIMVWQVLKKVARGMDWDEIVSDWEGSVSKEAIAEALEFSNQIFVQHSHKYVENEIPAA